MKFGIIDLASIVVPHWHAARPVTDSDGTLVHAVIGFEKRLSQIREQCSHLIVAADRGYDHRRKIYPEYKANREPMAPDLINQLSMCEQHCEAIGTPLVSAEGFEADDIIATMARRLREADRCDTIIYSNDKDLRQCLSARVSLYSPKGGTWTPERLKDEWGITAQQVVGYQALVGDSTDNIPGAKGIGPKAAQRLLEDFGSLDGIYANLERVTPARLQKLLEDNKENIWISVQLCHLKDDLPIELDPASTRVRR